jgi:O-antigen/teichoic acid export membrane protein
VIFRDQVVRALKWTVIGRFGTQLVSWAVTILVMRLLVPGDYGLLAMATIFSSLFAVVAEVGLGSSLVQSTEVSARQMRQVFAVVLLSNSAVFAVMAFVIAPLAAAFFAEARLEPIIRVVALQFIPAAFTVIPGAMLHRELLYGGRSVVEFVASACGSLFTLGLAYAGYGAWSLAWGAVLAATLRAAGYSWLRPYKELPLFDFTGMGQIIRFGRDVAANQLVYHFYSQADSLIVGKLLGRHDLGLYSVSMDLASLPASRLASILNVVAFPAMSKVKRDGGSVNPYVLKSIRGISLIAFPVMWGMSSVSQEIVNGLLGSHWGAATTPLSLLCLIMPLRVLGPIIHAALQSVGRADVSFRNTCTTAVVMCLAFVVGCQFGLTGLASAWVLAFPLVFVANVLRACPHLNLRLAEVLSALSRPLVASGIMYAAVATAREWLTLNPLAMLGVLVLVGGVAYLVSSLVFNKKDIFETLRLLRPAKQ